MNSANPIDALIAEYAAGTLPLAAKVLVDAHMELVPASRQWAGTLENAAGCELDRIAPQDLDDADLMMEAIFSADSDMAIDAAPLPLQNGFDPSQSVLPKSLQSFVGDDIEAIRWSRKMPGIRKFTIGGLEGGEASLLSIKPGLAIPTHTHEGRELTLVLKGGFKDGYGHYVRGDIAIADDTVDHRPVADDDEECICFAVTEAPLKFTGPIARIVSRLLPN